MESIYTVATVNDARDWFPSHSMQHNQARRAVRTMMRNDLGVLLDEGFDPTSMPDVWYLPLFYGACIALRRLHGWAVYGEWVHMTASDVANNFGRAPFDMIV